MFSSTVFSLADRFWFSESRFGTATELQIPSCFLRSDRCTSPIPISIFGHIWSDIKAWLALVVTLWSTNTAGTKCKIVEESRKSDGNFRQKSWNCIVIFEFETHLPPIMDLKVLSKLNEPWLSPGRAVSVNFGPFQASQKPSSHYLNTTKLNLGSWTIKVQIFTQKSNMEASSQNATSSLGQVK